MITQISGKQFGRVLVFLILYLFVSPFFPSGSTASLLVHFLLSVTLFLAAYAVQRNSQQRSIAMGLMALTLVTYWLGIFKLVPYSAEGALILFAGFYALLIYSLIRQLINSSHVTSGVLSGTMCLYLVIGLFWGTLYTLLEVLSPSAFSGALLENPGTSELHLFNYFSLVTLTSLGYGDITPQIPGAASLCQMQAIVGQFFTAVLVAWLVGMYGKPNPKHETESLSEPNSK